MARRENIFFFVSDSLQLINTAYCCSTILSIIVHLVARGRFLKKESWKRGRKQAFLLHSAKIGSPSLTRLLCSPGSGASSTCGDRWQRSREDSTASAGPEKLLLGHSPSLPAKLRLLSLLTFSMTQAASGKTEVLRAHLRPTNHFLCLLPIP